MSMIARWFAVEGSTRSLALIRIGLVLLLWDRFAGEFALFTCHDLASAAFSLLFFASTTAMLVGLATPIAAPLTAGVCLWILYGMGVYGGVEPYQHHHIALFAFLATWLAFSPCGRSLSVDRWLALRRGTAAFETGQLWALRLISLQVFAAYAWATYEKLTPAFLGGARMQEILVAQYGNSDPIGVPAFPTLCMVMACSATAIEATLAVGLWFRRSRP